MRHLLAVLLLAACQPAFAQAADRPVVKVGDRWDFVVWYTVPSSTPNRAWTITAIAADRIEGTENGEPLLLTPELNMRDSPLFRDSSAMPLRFPLEVGKRWRHTSTWLFKPKQSSGTTQFEVAIVAHERVRVPAGEFDAFRLEAKGSIGGRSPVNSIYAGEITITYWYAPAARAIVKSQVKNPYLGPSTIELVSLRPAP